uniref:Uncharacterized protein n=1 Tax=Anopheles epiroticus TaxID=199890 RepID=A0A182PYZ1_9DIPT
MALLQRAIEIIYNLLQDHYDVGHPSKQFFLLRCLDVVSPAMLIPRPRSNLEVAIKTLCLGIMISHIVGLTYDLCQQTDVRLAMDMLSMLSLFSSTIMRGMCMQQYTSHIHTLEKIERKPTFRVGKPYVDLTRKTVASQNNRVLGCVLVMHFLTASVYVCQNMMMKDSFVKIITCFPFDLSPPLEKLAELCYSLVGYLWAWYHAATQLTIIVLLRFAITEFRVFLHSLATLDDQIQERLLVDHDEERVVRDLLHEHARQHSHLVVVVMRLRELLRTYSLLHFFFYMIIMASLMTRTAIIPGSSSLGYAIPLLVALIFFFETFGLCMLVESLVQLNRKVSIQLYEFSWPQYLRYGRSLKRTMILMIMQANTTQDFSAGGMTTVSAELFAKSCRLIYTITMFMANLAS